MNANDFMACRRLHKGEQDGGLTAYGTPDAEPAIENP